MSELVGQDRVGQMRRKIAAEESALMREAQSQTDAEDRATPALAKRKTYWRSVGDLLRAPSFLKWAEDEFPQLDEQLNRYQEGDGPSRRKFLQLMGASIALAGFGLTGCRRPEDKIRPYNRKPVDIVIGKAMYYATTFVLAGKAMGVLAETHEGRPTKIEGNPLHPNSGGGTDVFAQASILELYDPDRSRNYVQQGATRTREEFVAFVDALAKQLRDQQGAGLAVLLQGADAPAMEMVLGQMGKDLPKANVYAYEPLRGDMQLPRPVYDFSKARLIVALDADVLGMEDDGIRYRRQFAQGRRAENPKEMNRLYVVEPSISQTGAIADHRLALPASRVGAFAQALLNALSGQAIGSVLNSKAAKWVGVLAEELKAQGEQAVVIAGVRQSPAVHALVAQINHAIASRAVSYQKPAGLGAIKELAEQIRLGNVKTLVIAHGNPAYDAPADLGLAALIKQVPQTVRLGLYEDETSMLCTWHVPATHYLESWGDARSTDGVISALQPMIEPLFAGMSSLELLARLAGYARPDAYELVRASFTQYAADGSEEAWRKFLQEGVVEGKAAARVEASAFASVAGKPAEPAEGEIEICFAADAKVYDGRFANNGWLQECPDPVTKLTWDNAAIIGPEFARRLGVQTGDVLKIELHGAAIEAPVYVLPGVVDNSITLPLGYGRTAGGALAKDTGFNAYLLRTSGAMGFAVGANVSATGKKYPLATTQEHWALDLDKHFANVADEQAKERAIIREVTPEQLEKDPQAVKKMGEHAPIRLSIYTEPTLAGANQWAMAIDLNACVGCNACVVACQAENNVPIVGKNEVLKGREMHWLRLDRYFTGENNDAVQVSLQPMACQHCENAPCEPVCPVNATVHSPEGLNEMVYNRCIGTRYCSNNCPYKVRRFNYLDWNKGTLREEPAAARTGNRQPDPLHGQTRPQIFQPPMQEMLKMAENPNVTVRIRGVMEKCTYCVQRIEGAKIAARSAVGQGKANAMVNGESAVKVGEGMVMTACQQVCPTQAIIFGDKSDPNSRLNKQWDTTNNGRSYEVLEHLNVRPRTHYLAKVRNVNPRLEESHSSLVHSHLPSDSNP